MSDDLQLIEKIKSYNSYVDENIIKNAYKYASEAHKSQKRHSGDPYISHPLAVANILAELKTEHCWIQFLINLRHFMRHLSQEVAEQLS